MQMYEYVPVSVHTCIYVLESSGDGSVTRRSHYRRMSIRVCADVCACIYTYMQTCKCIALRSVLTRLRMEKLCEGTGQRRRGGAGVVRKRTVRIYLQLQKARRICARSCR